MEKRTLVADSSIVAKWFLTEDTSEKALELRDQFATGRLMIAVPSLVYYEVANALRFSGAYNEAELGILAKSLSKYPFSVRQLRGKLLHETLSLSMREGITVYDSSYVALALRMKISLCSEDSELLSKFPKTVLSLEKLEL